MNFELDNESFAQLLVSEIDFEAKKKGRRTVKSCRKLGKGKKVYGKSGKVLKGLYVKRTL